VASDVFVSVFTPTLRTGLPACWCSTSAIRTPSAGGGYQQAQTRLPSAADVTCRDPTGTWPEAAGYRCSTSVIRQSAAIGDTPRRGRKRRRRVGSLRLRGDEPRACRCSTSVIRGPRRVGTVTRAVTRRRGRVGEYAYVADVGGVQVINVRDPANPQRIVAMTRSCTAREWPFRALRLPRG